MEILTTQLINGIATGAIYALLAICYNLLLLIKGIFQFALAHIVVMSVYLIWVVMGLSRGSILMGLVLSIPAGIAVGVRMSIVTKPIFQPMAVPS